MYILFFVKLSYSLFFFFFFEKRASCLRSHSSKWSGSSFTSILKYKHLTGCRVWFCLLTKRLWDLAFCQPKIGVCLFLISLIIKNKEILAKFFKISGEVLGFSYNRFWMILNQLNAYSRQFSSSSRTKSFDITILLEMSCLSSVICK